jgi:hypothetical protein
VSAVVSKASRLTSAASGLTSAVGKASVSVLASCPNLPRRRRYRLVIGLLARMGEEQEESFARTSRKTAEEEDDDDEEDWVMTLNSFAPRG